MTKRLVDLREQRPILDIASYGRRGPAHRHLTAAEVGHISRTVRRAPEVVVKVSGGARTLRGVKDHLEYIGREGEEQVETDLAGYLQGKGWEKALLEDWDLDLEAHRRHTERAVAAGRKPPKLVHNLVFSMPKGSPPEKVYEAVKVFAREKFALQHRYAMALHIDQGHPHVHVVVKALSEEGVRLNIRKATLREWRRDFAQYLCELGVEANATERAVRGQCKAPKLDGIYRAMLRNDSTHMRKRAYGVVMELASGGLKKDPGNDTVWATRRSVTQGWLGLAEIITRQGNIELASNIRRFIGQMPPPRTEKEMLAYQLQARVRAIDDRAFTP